MSGQGNSGQGNTANAYADHLRWLVMRLSDGEHPDLAALESEALDTLDALLAALEAAEAERDERITKASGRALVDEATRWENAYLKKCNELEAAEARAERAEGRIRELAVLFGVPDAGRYLNDWRERASATEQLRRALEAVVENEKRWLTPATKIAKAALAADRQDSDA